MTNLEQPLSYDRLSYFGHLRDHRRAPIRFYNPTLKKYGSVVGINMFFDNYEGGCYYDDDTVGDMFNIENIGDFLKGMKVILDYQFSEQEKLI